MILLKDAESHVEYLESAYRCWLRPDDAARDARAMIGVKYAAS